MSDLIDRQQTIEAICMETCGVSLKTERCMVHCTEVQAVEKLPPAQPEPYTDALKAEIKRMKRSFTICINSDYYTGYMSALSAVEGYIAQTEVAT